MLQERDFKVGTLPLTGFVQIKEDALTVEAIKAKYTWLEQVE